MVRLLDHIQKIDKLSSEVLELKTQVRELSTSLGQATERLRDIKALLAVALDFASDTEDDDAPLFLKSVLKNALSLAEGEDTEGEE